MFNLRNFNCIFCIVNDEIINTDSIYEEYK